MILRAAKTAAKQAARVRHRPVPHRALTPPADPGLLLEFATDGATVEVPLPLPRLPGMDAIEISLAEASIGARGVERVTNHAAPTGGVARLRFTGGVAGAPVRLLRLEVEGFSPGAEPVPRHLAGGSGGTLRWPAGSNAPGGAAQPASQALHLLLGPEDGPPARAAPAFPMPGAGGALYGEALGGMTLSATQGTGPVRLVLTPRAPLALTGLALRAVRLAPGVPALPQEGQPVPWRATALRAVWEVLPATLTVEAHGGGRAIRVAEVPGDAGRPFTGFDFAAALRGLAPALLTGGGVALRVTARGAGAARLHMGELGARYLRHPLTRPEARQLRGAAECWTLAGPPLRPQALDLAIEGRFRPERLVDSAADTPRHPRRGLLAEGAARIAAPAPLTPAERALPLARVAVHGRAALPTELLLTLHAGDARRVGAALGPGVALELPAEDAPRWHRAALAIPAPQPAWLWLVVQAPRGRFLWHEAEAGGGAALHSPDAGGSWQPASMSLAWQVAVREAMAAPAPLGLHWQGGLLTEDAAAADTAEFRQRLLLEAPADAALLDSMAHTPLGLRFTCRRDVDFALSDVTLAYDPWAARP